MEFLEGETLADRLKSGPLPIEEVRKISIEVADALDKAHSRGMVHRDLKPANIFLKGTAVVGANGIGQAAFFEQTLKGSKRSLFLDGLHGFAEQEKTAGVSPRR
jgi:serine/threonine protein kinase